MKSLYYTNFCSWKCSWQLKIRHAAQKSKNKPNRLYLHGIQGAVETYQVGAHFKALIKAIRSTPSRILESFFSFHVSLPRCVQLHWKIPLLSVPFVLFHEWLIEFWRQWYSMSFIPRMTLIDFCHGWYSMSFIPCMSFRRFDVSSTPWL